MSASVPTRFQSNCIARLQQVLAAHGHRVDFVFEEGDVPGFFGALTFHGLRHDIEVYPDSVVMHQGESLFEAYMAAELVDDESYVEAFARRLDRYLSGGPWEGEDERGWFDWVLDAIFGKRPRSGAPQHPEVPYPVTVTYPDGEQEVFDDEDHLVTNLEHFDSDPSLSPEGRTRVVDAQGREYRLRIDHLEITWFEPLDLDARERREKPSPPR